MVARQQQQQQQQKKTGHMYGPVPDLLSRGTVYSPAHQYNNGGGERGSIESSGTDESHPSTPHSFPSTPSSNYPPPPSSLLASYPPRSPLTRGEIPVIVPSHSACNCSHSFNSPPYLLNSHCCLFCFLTVIYKKKSNAV